MGLLKNFIENFKRKKEKEKEFTEDIRIQQRVMQKQKDANDRELERYYEEARKKQVQEQLHALRKQKTQEIWSSNIFAHNRNVFSGDKCYLGRYY